MPTYSGFIKSFLIFSILIAAPALLIYFNVDHPLVSKTIPAQLIFFIATTALLHFFFLKALSKKPQMFVNYFMGITTLKLFLYLIVIVTYFFLHKKEATSFLIAFMFFYLVFTTFEVVTLMRANKK